jgi:hypothetical protein
MDRRHRMRTILIAALLACTFAAIPASGASAVPHSTKPFFMAGGQCDKGSPYVKYRVTNVDTKNHMLVIKVDGDLVLGPIALAKGATKKGKFVYDDPPNSSRSVVARWKDENSSHRAKLRFRTDNCEKGESRGPWFIAGQYCSKNGVNRVKFSIKNFKDTEQPVNVRVTDGVNQHDEKIWPNHDDHKILDPGEKITNTRKIPPQYGPGDEVRVRGWWVIGDPAAHNRAVFDLFNCNA